MILAGVTCANQSANTFGWVCTHGVCACLQVGAVAGGDIISTSPTAGAVQTLGLDSTDVSDAAKTSIVGYCVQASAGNASGSYLTIYLQLE